MNFLPACLTDLTKAGLKPGDLDVIFVTGDAYVDHASFGVALLARFLESRGYKAGILARPDPDDVEAFRQLGKPRLAFLVTAGAVDSMVSNYTANRKLRSEDEYAPGKARELCQRADGTIGPGIKNRSNARPDRATIVYTGMCRQAFKGVPVVIGGLEASLRRLAHYDFWSDSVRKSILLDSKADILVYGMGELQLEEILKRLTEGSALDGIPGTVRAVHVGAMPEHELKQAYPEALILPGYSAISGADPVSRQHFAESFAAQYRNTDPFTAKPLLERYGDRLVIQEPPIRLLERGELDALYALPFTRQWHPMYQVFGGVPALAEVKFSLLSSRGCYGACSFCALTMHQGRLVSSRSAEAIVREAQELAALPDFKGNIHDVGGPTANFRKPACEKMAKKGACVDRLCLAPKPCKNLSADHREYVEILRKLRALPGVKKVFVRSGVRFDYAMLDPSDEFLKELVEHHISGQLKVAPEHVSEKVLQLMGKPPLSSFEAFKKKYEALNQSLGKKQYLIPYFISAHPGSGLAEALELALYLKKTGFVPDQVQDFYPTPGTLSTAMWWCGMNPLDGEPVYVAKGAHERSLQRALLQFNKPQNRELVKEALQMLGRTDLIGNRPGCLIR